MQVTTTKRRFRAVVVAACTAAVLAPLAAMPAATATPRAELLTLINEERTSRDLRRVGELPRVSRIARSHSEQMVRRREVFPSSNLPGAISGYDWREWGENTTCGPTIRWIHRHLMRNRSSRRNLLNPVFRSVGLGVARSRSHPNVCRGGTYWVTEIFFG